MTAAEGATVLLHAHDAMNLNVSWALLATYQLFSSAFTTPAGTHSLQTPMQSAASSVRPASAASAGSKKAFHALTLRNFTPYDLRYEITADRNRGTLSLSSMPDFSRADSFVRSAAVRVSAWGEQDISYMRSRQQHEVLSHTPLSYNAAVLIPTIPQLDALRRRTITLHVFTGTSPTPFSFTDLPLLEEGKRVLHLDGAAESAGEHTGPMESTLVYEVRVCWEGV